MTFYGYERPDGRVGVRGQSRETFRLQRNHQRTNQRQQENEHGGNESIVSLLSTGASSVVPAMFLCYLIGMIFRVAQGSGTVAGMWGARRSGRWWLRWSNSR